VIDHISTIPLRFQICKDLTEALSRLKELIGQGATYSSYKQVDSFFEPIQSGLLDKYGQNSVMIGSIKPLKYAVIQAQ
jgi:hypothetical protein